LPRPSSSFDVAVVGGGVIGLSVAWRAARRGLRVIVLERDEPGAGTSSVAAGMLAPITEASLAEQAVLRLGLLSARMYPDFLAELRAAVPDLDPGYLMCGTLAIARDRDEAEALERELQLRLSLGLEVERLRPSQARDLEPALAPGVRLGLRVPSDHAIDPRKLTGALVLACRAAGAEVRSRVAVATVETESDGAVAGARLSDGTLIGAPQVVIAAGSWAGEIGGIPESARVPLHPVKGQIMRLRDPAGPGLLSRVLRMGRGYVVPRGDGRYVLGATMEERGFDTTVTAGAVYELLRDAGELVPGISELVIEELSAGLRPAAPDNAPVIGRSAVPGLRYALGHYRNGILLAPVTAEILAAELDGEGTPDYAAPFGPERFAVGGVPVGA
jgi:glycine oxidase